MVYNKEKSTVYSCAPCIFICTHDIINEQINTRMSDVLIGTLLVEGSHLRGVHSNSSTFLISFIQN